MQVRSAVRSVQTWHSRSCVAHLCSDALATLVHHSQVERTHLTTIKGQLEQLLGCTISDRAEEPIGEAPMEGPIEEPIANEPNDTPTAPVEAREAPTVPE